jgi:hypothetical protein
MSGALRCPLEIKTILVTAALTNALVHCCDAADSLRRTRTEIDTLNPLEYSAYYKSLYRD